jgi:hypothetical protein
MLSQEKCCNFGVTRNGRARPVAVRVGRPRADPDESRDRAGHRHNGHSRGLHLFGEKEKKAALVTFGDGEEGQRRKAVH